jgi:hypothetical protein
MHHKDLKIADTFKIQDEFILMVEMDTPKLIVNVGDTLRYAQKVWEVTRTMGLPSNPNSTRFRLYVKEITQQELFCKLVSKEKSPWLSQAKWRLRNRWWIRVVQKVQLFLLNRDIKNPRWIFEITKAPRK